MRRIRRSKFITLFFDTEEYGKINFDETLGGILDVLDTHKVRAVFNICGAVVENHFECTKELAKKGHEIACHGYQHENFLELETSDLDAVLEKAETAYRRILNIKPIGARSPWLKQDKRIYDVLRRRGYCWVSNEPQQPVVFALHNPLRVRQSYTQLGSAFLRIRRRLFFGTDPYLKFGLIEIPLLSSFVSSLFSIENMDKITSDKKIQWAYRVIQKQYNHAGRYFNLNFHVYCIGSLNRLNLLERIITFVISQGDEFILARDIVKEYEKNNLMNIR